MHQMLADDVRSEPSVLHHIRDAGDNALAILDNDIRMSPYHRHGNFAKQRAHREPIRQPADSRGLEGLQQNLPAGRRDPSGAQRQFVATNPPTETASDTFPSDAGVFFFMGTPQ